MNEDIQSIKDRIDEIMNIDLEKISTVFEEEANKVIHESSVKEIGYVESVHDGIVIANGLLYAFIDEVIKFEDDSKGIVKDLSHTQVYIVLLDKFCGVKAGMKAFRTAEKMNVGCSYELLGRVVDALGNPIDGGLEINVEEYMPVMSKAHGLVNRKTVNEPLSTGFIAIDSAIPIGRGQRELIIGDSQTGKTSLAVATILNQRKYFGTDREVKCIYVAIGQKTDSLMRIYDQLKENKALDYTVIVAGTASYSAIQQFIAPYTGCAIAEFFMKRKHDCLIIYDDLSKHAVAHRENCRLLKRGAGRDAYPADSFYIHARLLERAACLKNGGSITALPIMETQNGDVSDYISTNVISITDGQIVLDADLFREGNRPSIDIGKSVSRVGSSAQSDLIKKTSKGLRIELSRYKELKSYSEISGSAIGKDQKKTLDEGQKLTAALIQSELTLYSESEQAIILITYTNIINPLKKIQDIKDDIKKFLDFMHANYAHMMESLEQNRTINKHTITEILNISNQYNTVSTSSTGSNYGMNI